MLVLIVNNLRNTENILTFEKERLDFVDSNKNVVIHLFYIGKPRIKISLRERTEVKENRSQVRWEKSFLSLFS